MVDEVKLSDLAFITEALAADQKLLDVGLLKHSHAAIRNVPDSACENALLLVAVAKPRPLSAALPGGRVSNGTGPLHASPATASASRYTVPHGRRVCQHSLPGQVNRGFVRGFVGDRSI